jgi:hypothetical protein
LAKSEFNGIGQDLACQPDLVVLAGMVQLNYYQTAMVCNRSGTFPVLAVIDEIIRNKLNFRG